VAEFSGYAPASVATDTRIPTVIVDDVHITYKIHGPSGGGQSPVAAFKRILTREKSPSIREVHAVKGVSFTAYEGEAVGLIGSNGSGKSTLLRAIAGLLPTDKGRMYIAGQPSLLGVSAALFNDLSGERNVVLGCLAMGMDLAEVRAQTQDIIDFSGINERGDFSSLPMRTYSSGMAARLKFSIAAARKHDVLLIDEALATGDASFLKRSEARVRELRASAGTVFLVSHSLSSILDNCERAVWLESGVMRMDGPAPEVCAAYEEYVRSK
jgi:teichoic acid transport system ATP-binding protein